MNKTTTGQETERSPSEIIVNDTGRAIEMLYDCKSKIEVFSQLFNLKRNEDKGDDDFEFYDGLKTLNEEMYNHIAQVIELLWGVEYKGKEAAETAEV